MNQESHGLENVITQKIMKTKKDKKGNVISRKQIGNLVAGICEGSMVAIGYSLCHRNDQYNVINGIRTPGFGEYVAYERAVKYAFDSELNVPISIKKDVERFAERCKKYYWNGALEVQKIVSNEYHVYTYGE
jgi:hypothetical protein